MQWFTLKDKDGNLSRIPIPSGSDGSYSSAILQKPENPENRYRHAKHLSSVLAKKSVSLAKMAMEKKRLHDLKRMEIVKKHYDAVDAILDDKTLEPKQKFRKLQRYMVDHKKQLTDYQIHMFNQELQELDLKHGITPDEVEPKVKTVNDKNPNPVTFAEMDKDIQVSKDKNPEPITFSATSTPTQDEQALNKLAKEFQANRAKEKLDINLQAEIDAINRRDE